MTLTGVKFSTKDIDFMVPRISEYKYLIKQLKSIGYEQETGSGWKKSGNVFHFDFFQGNYIHTTELLNSPLNEGNHSLLKEFSYLYIGVLNDYDLICSKLMRGTEVDFEDCLALAEAHRTEIDIKYLIDHFHELISYDVSHDRIKLNIDIFMDMLKARGVF